MSEIKRHKDYALKSLRNNEDARNCDWELFFDALERENNIFIPSFIKEAIKYSKVNYKTLIRQRAMIQSEGLFLPTDAKVISKRRLKQQEIQKHFSNTSLEQK